MHDLIVIGGGVMGCSIALRCAQRGLSVMVLERSVPGAEASSAVAGILAPQQECEADGPAFRLGLASRARFAEVARELLATTGIDIGYRRTGLIAVAFAGEPEAEAALAAKAAWQSRLGLAVEEMDGDEARLHEPELASCARALRFPDEAQVEPPRLIADAPVTRTWANFRPAADAIAALASGEPSPIDLAPFSPARVVG